MDFWHFSLIIFGNWPTFLSLDPRLKSVDAKGCANSHVECGRLVSSGIWKFVKDSASY